MGSEFQNLRYLNDVTWDRRYGNTEHNKYVDSELDVNGCRLSITTIKPVNTIVEAKQSEFNYIILNQSHISITYFMFVCERHITHTQKQTDKSGLHNYLIYKLKGLVFTCLTTHGVDVAVK